MKRDPDLIRQLLQIIEQAPLDGIEFPPTQVTDHPLPVVLEHLRLLQEAEFIEAVFHIDDNGPAAAWVKRLTWKGHEFLDATRDDQVWNKTKTGLSQTITSVALEVITQIASKVALGQLFPK